MPLAETLCLSKSKDATMKCKQFSDVFDVKSMYVCKIVFEFEQVRLRFGNLSLENREPDTLLATKADTSTKIVQTQLLSQSPSQVQQVQLSSSRVDNFCQILDMGSSLSLLSPQKNTSQGKPTL